VGKLQLHPSTAISKLNPEQTEIYLPATGWSSYNHPLSAGFNTLHYSHFIKDHRPESDLANAA